MCSLSLRLTFYARIKDYFSRYTSVDSGEQIDIFCHFKVSPLNIYKNTIILVIFLIGLGTLSIENGR